MGTIAEKLQGIINSKAAIKASIEAKGVTVGNVKLAEYAAKVAEIQGASDEWVAPSEWPGIKTILNNDVQVGQTKQYIVLITDSRNTITLSEFGGTAWKTSEGNFYSASQVVTWNRANDITTTYGYSLRWVIVYGASQAVIRDWLYSTPFSSLYYVFAANTSVTASNMLLWENKSVQALDFSQCTTLSFNNGNFQNCMALESVVLPPVSVSLSTGSLFAGCYKLKYINLENVTAIGGYVFNNNYSLKKVTIPSGVTDIGDHTYTACTSLEEIIIPSSVTTLSAACLYGCSSLRELVIPGSVTAIDINYGLKPLVGLLDLQVYTNFDIAINFSDSVNMTAKSLEAIITNLKNNAGIINRTITMGAGNIAKLSSTYTALAASKNWTLA